MASYCDGVKANDDKRCLCNEGALGPKNVADGSSPAVLVSGYERLGTLKPAAFLDKWAKFTYHENNRRDTKWLWPNESKQGFLLDTQGNPVTTEIELGPGTLVDRFGTDDTVYFAPLGTPFAMRSLPPSSLNPEQEYAVYEIKQKLRVRAGPIAPGFEQPGLGTQYISTMGPEELVDKSDQLAADKKWLRKLSREEVETLYCR